MLVFGSKNESYQVCSRGLKGDQSSLQGGKNLTYIFLHEVLHSVMARTCAQTRAQEWIPLHALREVTQSVHM